MHYFESTDEGLAARKGSWPTAPTVHSFQYIDVFATFLLVFLSVVLLFVAYVFLFVFACFFLFLLLFAIFCYFSLCT